MHEVVEVHKLVSFFHCPWKHHSSPTAECQPTMVRGSRSSSGLQLYGTLRGFHGTKGCWSRDHLQTVSANVTAKGTAVTIVQSRTLGQVAS